MSPKELQKDVDDLKTALRTIGKILVDTSLKQAQRTDRILGILAMYEVDPKKAGSA